VIFASLIKPWHVTSRGGGDIADGEVFEANLRIKLKYHVLQHPSIGSSSCNKRSFFIRKCLLVVQMLSTAELCSYCCRACGVVSPLGRNLRLVGDCVVFLRSMSWRRRR